ncbi:MAG: hypothetical protein KatS3mg105_0320 [Gemmatales bacterium]|nr:MAG: hypothetical protein KatS3mg105_0320 [Gemmatales bacterium]
MQSQEKDSDEFAGKKISEWIKLLESQEATVKQRQAALIVMDVVGPKAKGVSEAVIRVLKRDKEPALRRIAAQTLGEWGGEISGIADALAETVQNR